MRNFILLFILLAFAAGNAQSGTIIKHTKYGTLHQFKANPQAGYNFDYLLYLPAKLAKGTPTRLLVETNNGGTNDSIAHHEKTAIHTASESSVGNYVAEKLGLPLLVPIFPRPASRWELYTHALDRDTFLTKDFGLERLDLQLLAMITDAKKQVEQLDYRVREKFFMVGFSASGTFANRFSLLHAYKMQATASGGINAIAILPISRFDGQALNYPLGKADIKDITGNKADCKAFAALPKLLFMGELDENDAAAFDDAYSTGERTIIYNLMGRHLKERWAFVQKIYRDEGAMADFRTYPGIGHGTDLKINNDLAEFFMKYME